ncbi:hypothetical protein SAY86_018550 [Trapa natans]|uniref:Ribosomal eL28/Mak16 domain-containing protein n=1 Tax=Trapa natans TaxID=22666 RepID=A0AAN7LCY3_TRANT|nr:hypothetical protein SAY86_018550 [Trapa natans]
MQHDEVIWQVIRHNHCSYMAKITTGKFCRNPYNVTGICNRSSCPLSNSRYATIRDEDGIFYLYMKTIERAHMPNKLWEKVKLPRNYEKALEIIDKHLMYWPKFLVHKTKQRLTKMTQMRIRMRKLALKTREKIMTIPRKEKKREARREEKAEKAAVLEKSIENELLERLKKGIQGDIYNYPVKEYNKVLDMDTLQAADEEEEELEHDIEYVEGYDDLEEEEDIEDFDNFAVKRLVADEENYEEDEDGDEDIEPIDWKRGRLSKVEKDEAGAKSKKRQKVFIEISGTRFKLHLSSHPQMTRVADLLCSALALLFTAASSTTFTLVNKCAYAVWPGILSGAGTPQLPITGFALQPGEASALSIPLSWSGNLWGRTGCNQDATTGKFSCLTGDCGSSNGLECSGRGAAPPTTLAEFTLNGAGGLDFYDVSLVDGHNLPIIIAPQGGTGAGNCSTVGCAGDLNAACPNELKVSDGSASVACKSACNAFGDPQYCCSGAYDTPETCQPSVYSEFFKNACPTAYSYAYDDGTSTFTCAGADYLITFCPSPSTSVKTTGGHYPPATTDASSGNSEAKGSISVSLFIVASVILAAI